MSETVVSEVNSDGARIIRRSESERRRNHVFRRIRAGRLRSQLVCSRAARRNLPSQGARHPESVRRAQRAEIGHELPLPAGREKRLRGSGRRRRRLPDLCGRIDGRHLPERADPQRDGHRPAAGLPRLRARLAGERRRLRRAVRPDPGPGPARRQAARRRQRPLLPELRKGPRGRRRTDEPRRRPLRREEDERRLDHHLRRNRGRRPAVPGPVRVDAARGVRRPLDPPLRRPRNLQPVLRGRQDRPCPFAATKGRSTQGMAGSLDPGPLGRTRRLRRHGGSRRTAPIWSSARPPPSSRTRPASGDVSIYDRDLVTGVTHVVSKTPGGADLPCLQGAGTCHGPGDADGIASLDVSDDGSRIVVAQRVATDSAGNRYWHPYMNIGDSPSTVDLAPGTTSGVLYDGMTSDGSSVLYTTVDKLTADDHDASADIYRADVSPGGARHGHAGLDRLRRRRHRLLRPGAGRGPQQLERRRRRVDEQLRRRRLRRRSRASRAGPGRSTSSRPRGSTAPRASRTSRTSTCPQPGRAASLRRHPGALQPRDHATPSWTARWRGFGDFQVTPSGDFAAFSSAVPLTGFPTAGHTAIYRYEAPGDSLICASCPTTRATLNADTELSEYGLNLADDGRVFFTSTEPLGAARHRRVLRRLRVEERTALPDLDGPLADGNGPALGQRRRAQRLLLHTGDAGERRSQRKDGEDLHRAGKRGLCDSARDPGMPGIRRVPRARLRGAALRRPADLPGDRRRRKAGVNKKPKKHTCTATSKRQQASALRRQ